MIRPKIPSLTDVIQQEKNNKKANNAVPIKYQLNQTLTSNYGYDAPKNFYVNTNNNSFETLQESRESSLEHFIPHEELEPMRVLTLGESNQSENIEEQNK